MLRHNSCIPGQPVPIYLSTHISNSFLGRFTRKTTIGCRDPNQGVFLTSLNKLAILMQNHLIKSSRESPMLLPIHQDTRYVSRRINTCRENSLNIKFKVKHPWRMPIVIPKMNFATITNLYLKKPITAPWVLELGCNSRNNSGVF